MASILPSALNCCPTAFCSAPTVVAVPGPQGSVGPPGADATAGLAGMFIRDNLASARLVPASPINTLLWMLGGAVKGDTFAATFYWDNDSFALDDYTTTGGSVINPTGNSGAGRWLRF